MAQTINEQNHPRIFRNNKYVYPALSRRARGISVGINLNPDKHCNFHCVYCQVDRSTSSDIDFVALPQLRDELKGVLSGLQPGGVLWSEPEFRELPAEKARVTDIAFSGDGEPSMFRNFSEVVRHCAEVKESLGFTQEKIVLITNATGLERPDVRQALAFLDSHGGEVWAKLDAGTPGYFALISETKIPFQKILNNILECARARPTVIQSCFVSMRGQGPSFEQITAYVGRLKQFVQGGGQIKLVQVYTAARAPAYSTVSSLSNKEVQSIAERVRKEARLPAEAFFGDVPEGQGLLDRGQPQKNS